MTNPCQVKQIDHCSVIVADTGRALEFYTGVLGLEVDSSRPEMAYPGAWLKVGSGQIHLLELPNPDPVEGRPQHGGRDRHVALSVADLDAAIEALESKGLNYTASKSGRRALFCRDYDGNGIELVEK
jgi:glyoxylase I family protein